MDCFHDGCVAFVGCKKTPEVVPDPEIMKLNVLPGTSVTSGDEITVEFESKNAVSNENNIGAPTTTSWVYKTTATLNMTNIKVTAINSVGRQVTATKLLTVVAPYAPTLIDSLSFTWEKESQSTSWDNGITWIDEIIPEKFQKWHLTFYKTGDFDVYLYPYNKESFWGKDKWFINGRKIKYDFIWKDFILTKDKKLILLFPSSSIDSDNVEHKTLCREIYVGL